MEPWPARVAAMPVAGFLGWNWNRTSPPVRSAMAGTVSPSFRVPAARVCRSAVHLGTVVGDVKAGHGAPLPSRPYRVATRLCVIEPDSASRNTTARPNRLSSLNLDCCLRIERLSVTQGWTASTPDGKRNVNRPTWSRRLGDGRTAATASSPVGRK